MITHSFGSGLSRDLFQLGASMMLSQSHPGEAQCPNCQVWAKDCDLKPINANESVCPDCHREIMRDFNAS